MTESVPRPKNRNIKGVGKLNKLMQDKNEKANNFCQLSVSGIHIFWHLQEISETIKLFFFHKQITS